MNNTVIQMEMKWTQAARIIIMLMESGTEQGKADAKGELMKMAEAADHAVTLQRELEILTVGGCA